MSYRAFVFAVVVIAIFVMAASSPVVDSDTWWHLRAGSWMLENHQFLRTDLFSTTRLNQPWIYPGWLAQLSMIASYQLGGLAGLHLWTAIILSITFLLVWLMLEGPLLVRAFVLILAAVTSSVFWSARPHVLSMALTAGILLLLERYTTRRSRWIWLTVALMALWPNLHGAFATGGLLIGIYLLAVGIDTIDDVWIHRVRLAEAWRTRRVSLLTLAGCLLLGLLAIGLNPNGYSMLGYAGKTLSIGVLRDFIQEWQSPDFHDPRSQLFLFMLLLLPIIFASTPRRPATREVMLVTAFGAMAFLAWRNVALFAIVSAPVLSRHLALSLHRLPPLPWKSKDLPPQVARRLNLALLAGWILLAGILLARFLDSRRIEQSALERIPVAAIQRLQQDSLPGPVFNSYNWGAYIIWALYPDYRSFVDGRTDLFDDAILLDYLRAWRGDDGWDEVLDTWGIETVLIEPQAPLVQELERAGWMLIYSDDQAVVFRRPAG